MNKVLSTLRLLGETIGAVLSAVVSPDSAREILEE